MRRRSLALAACILAVAGCRKAPAPDVETRPEWRSAAIEGIAPLMSPAEVQAALDRRGYRQVACSSTSPILTDPFHQGAAIPCFMAPGSPTRISLFFLDLREGRRLAVAYFNQFRFDLSDQQRIAASQDYAQRLRKRFGKPSYVTRNPNFTTLYWHRPGGKASLPDDVSTTISKISGPNVQLRSMWAYGQERPSATPSDPVATPATNASQAR